MFGWLIRVKGEVLLIPMKHRNFFTPGDQTKQRGGRVGGDLNLSRGQHLGYQGAAHDKNQLNVESILIENPFVLGHPQGRVVWGCGRDRKPELLRFRGLGKREWGQREQQRNRESGEQRGSIHLFSFLCFYQIVARLQTLTSLQILHFVQDDDSVECQFDMILHR